MPEDKDVVINITVQGAEEAKTVADQIRQAFAKPLVDPRQQEHFTNLGSKFSHVTRMGRIFAGSLASEVNPALGAIISAFTLGARVSSGFGVSMAALGASVAAFAAVLVTSIAAADRFIASQVAMKNAAVEGWGAILGTVKGAVAEIGKAEMEQEMAQKGNWAERLVFGAKGILGTKGEEARAQLAQATAGLFAAFPDEKLKQQIETRSKLNAVEQQSADRLMGMAQTEGEYTSALERRKKAEDAVVEIVYERTGMEILAIQRQLDAATDANQKNILLLQLKLANDKASADTEEALARRREQSAVDEEAFRVKMLSLRKAAADQEINLTKSLGSTLIALSQDYTAKREDLISRSGDSEMSQAQDTARVSVDQANFTYTSKINLLNMEIAKKKELLQSEFADADTKKRLVSEITMLDTSRVTTEIEHNSAILNARKQLYDQLKNMAEQERQIGGGATGMAMNMLKQWGYKGPITPGFLENVFGYIEQQTQGLWQQFTGGDQGPGGGPQGISQEQLGLVQQVAALRGQAAKTTGFGRQFVPSYFAGLGASMAGQTPSATPMGYSGASPESLGLTNVYTAYQSAFQSIEGVVRGSLENIGSMITDMNREIADSISEDLFKRVYDKLVRSFELEGNRGGGR